MTLRHDELKENAAGSEVRAVAPVWSVRTADDLLAFITPRAASGRGVFIFTGRHPDIINPALSTPCFQSQGPTIVAGPIIVL
jgi:hypothetical protein